MQVSVSSFLGQMDTLAARSSKRIDSYDKQKTTVRHTLENLIQDQFKNPKALTDVEVKYFKNNFTKKIDSLHKEFSDWRLHHFSQNKRPKRYITGAVAKISNKAISCLFEKIPNAHSTVTTSSSISSKKFKREDRDYLGYSKKETQLLGHAEHCCDFPKLALAVSKKSGKDINDACIALNKMDKQLKSPRTLTVAQVLKHL